MQHGRWVRLGQGPWLTDGFSKPLSVDESSITHLHERQGRPPGRLRRRRRPGRVRGRAGRGPAQGQVGRVADPARVTRTCGRASARRTRPGRCRPAITTHAAATSTPAGQVGREEGLGVVHGPVQRPHADRARLRGRRLQEQRRRRTRTRSPCSRNTQNVATTVTGIQSTLGLKTPQQARVIYYEGSSSFGNGYHYLDINESAALMSKLAGVPRPPAADAVGRAGLEQVRPGDHARHARGRRRERQHRRVRGRRLRAGRRRRLRRPPAARQRARRTGRGGHERREPGARCTRSPRPACA